VQAGSLRPDGIRPLRAPEQRSGESYSSGTRKPLADARGSEYCLDNFSNLRSHDHKGVVF
jgi:hypothetical protein